MTMLWMLGELGHICLLASDLCVKCAGHISDERAHCRCLGIGQVSESGDVPAHNEHDPPEQTGVVAMDDVPRLGPDDAVPVRRLSGITAIQEGTGSTSVHTAESSSSVDRRVGAVTSAQSTRSRLYRRPVAPTIRPAVDADLDAMVEILFAAPGVEHVAFMPSLAGARVFTRAVWQSVGIEEFVVAEDGGVAVGFAWLSQGGVSLGQGAKAAVRGWGVLGPARLVAKGWPRQLVEISMPPGPKIVELQVHPERRGTGVGTRLLEHVFGLVGSQPLSLTTRTDNPARRLYERHGFVVTEEKTSRYFERRTGAKGRVLMVRPPSSAK